MEEAVCASLLFYVFAFKIKLLPLADGTDSSSLFYLTK